MPSPAAPQVVPISSVEAARHEADHRIGRQVRTEDDHRPDTHAAPRQSRVPAGDGPGHDDIRDGGAGMHADQRPVAGPRHARTMATT